ncbi:MAG: hypothetical protein WD426_11995 [Anditalea sp.]
MKKLFVLAFLMAGLLNVSVYAQEDAEEAEEEITEEELIKFATMEDSVMAFYEMKNEELVDMIKNNEVIDAGRYNEIKAAWGDEEKLTEIEITPEEKTAYDEILSFMSSLSDEVRELKINLIKNDEILGISTYNKVNKAYKEDPEIKEKVDSLTTELKEKRTPTDEEASDPKA